MKKQSWQEVLSTTVGICGGIGSGDIVCCGFLGE